MAFGLNRVELIGRLGADVTVNHLTSGGRVANLSVATDESYINKQSGERVDKTEWHRIVTFQDGLISMFEKHAKKGRLVYIDGKLQTRRWTKPGEDGDRFSTEILLVPGGRVQFLDKPNGNGAPMAEGQAPANGSSTCSRWCAPPRSAARSRSSASCQRACPASATTTSPSPTDRAPRCATPPRSRAPTATSAGASSTRCAPTAPAIRWRCSRCDGRPWSSPPRACHATAPQPSARALGSLRRHASRRRERCLRAARAVAPELTRTARRTLRGSRSARLRSAPPRRSRTEPATIVVTLEQPITR